MNIRRTTPSTAVLTALLAALAQPAMTQTHPAQPNPATVTTAAEQDPHLWLEDVTGERALAWVRARNAETRAVLEAQPGFVPTRDGIRAILDSKDKIPAVSRRGQHLYNLWQDAANPRGLWRRTTLAEYAKPQPAWDVVLDLDALGKAEGENWVWGGATCRGPDYRLCLLQLSRGGADATVVREFDTVAKAFVKGGLTLPEAKTSVDWGEDDNIVYVGTDTGAGSLTDSGYPRQVRRWTRGQPIAQAPVVYEGLKADVSAWVSLDKTPGFQRLTAGRSIDFYRSEQFLRQGDRWVKLNKPDDAQVSFWRQHVLVELRSDWTDLQQGGRTWPRGSLLVGDAAAYLAGKPQFQALFTPTATRSLAGMTATATRVVINVLDNVASRLEEWLPTPQGWQQRLVNAPHPGALSVQALHDPQVKNDPMAEQLLVNYTDFLTPDSLQLATAGQDGLQRLKSRPAYFDTAGMRVEQRFATSRDGTRVPYFVVWPKGAQADGKNPTLLYGYGGFEVSMQPYYSGGIGRSWLAKGGVYVLANIRGGGEFGPAWHQAAVKHQKQKSYDDFAAVAEDLIKANITTAKQLGMEGGSNGGLLVGAVMLQRPELFGAVVCQVPLLDMQRYHQLLAGASWMAEYGNPDLPEDWAVLKTYSPYQNVKAGVKLPALLLITSTRDDRVHPGHARKMAAKLRDMGHSPMYYENIEGGHGGAADNAQRADMSALEYTFLWQQLGGR